MRRRKKEDEHENLERWLITYADLITLLLAFFIMMYTFSKQDAQKYQEVSDSLKAIFSGGSAVLKTGRGQAGTRLPPPVRPGIDGAEIRKELEEQIAAMADAEGPRTEDLRLQRTREALSSASWTGPSSTRAERS